MNVISRVLDWGRRRRQNLSKLARMGSDCVISPTAHFIGHENIWLGDACRIGPNCRLEGKGGIEIGDGTILAPCVIILSSTHNYEQTNALPYDNRENYRKVVIGSGVWIGYGAQIVPGVAIGDGAVVAMGAVVTRDVLSGQVVGGNPAKLIKVRSNLGWIQQAIAERQFYLLKYAPGKKTPNSPKQ